MHPTILSATSSSAFETGNAGGYIIGAIIALIILAYLLYSLIKPDKF